MAGSCSGDALLPGTSEAVFVGAGVPRLPTDGTGDALGDFLVDTLDGEPVEGDTDDGGFGAEPVGRGVAGGLLRPVVGVPGVGDCAGEPGGPDGNDAGLGLPCPGATADPGVPGVLLVCVKVVGAIVAMGDAELLGMPGVCGRPGHLLQVI